MIFAVRDFFEFHRQPLPDRTPPPQGSPLFNFIVGRLFDSFNIPGGVTKYFGWMTTPDHDTGIWPFIRPGLSRLTILDEWPKIRADIDAGHPPPLGAVTLFSPNPGDLGQNHQVLAYGYDLDDSSNLTLHVYDPNTSPAAADNVHLSLNIANPGQSTAITHNINIGHPIRGFFRTDYTAKDPTFLLPPPPALRVSVTPFPVPEGRSTITVRAEDASSHQAIPANISINGVAVGPSDVPISYNFVPTRSTRRVPGTTGPAGLQIWLSYPKGQATAAGFQPANIDFGLHDGWAEL
jgi:hypothetical protein